MIQALQLSNFKAFGPTPQRFPLKPLTLVFGPNSSGKSSFIHSLLWARHALETGVLDVHRPNGAGEAVDLGGFRQFTFRTDPENRITWSVELPASILPDNLRPLLAETATIRIEATYGVRELHQATRPLQMDDVMDMLDDPEEMLTFEQRKFMSQVAKDNVAQHRHTPPELLGYRIEAEGVELLRASRKRMRPLQLDTLVATHPFLHRLGENLILANSTSEQTQPGDFEALAEVVDELLTKLWLPQSGFVPEELEMMDLDDEDSDFVKGFNHGLRYEEPAIITLGRETRAADLKMGLPLEVARGLMQLLGAIAKAVKADYGRLRYLGPLRSYPARHLAFIEGEAPWDAGGAYAWRAVRDDEYIRGKVNAWLSAPKLMKCPYELRVDMLASFNQMIKALESELPGILYDKYKVMQEGWEGGGDLIEWIDEFDKWGNEQVLTHLKAEMLAAAGSTAGRDLTLVDKRTNTVVTHRDVGVGISQLLPVLVYCYGLEQSLIAIEQPEIHVHPALQAELGDLFIESAMTRGNHFVLETHSEHLILRILRRIRGTAEGELEEGKTPIRPGDVCVLYISPGKENGSEVVHLPVNAEGDFDKPWPDGFFPERAKELF